MRSPARPVPLLILLAAAGWGCGARTGTPAADHAAVVDAEPPALSDRVSEFFGGEISTCAGLKAWMASHADIMLATDTATGLVLRLRSLEPLAACCDDRDWNAHFTDTTFAAAVRERRRSQQFVLELRSALPRASYAAILDSLQAPHATDRWYLVQEGDTVPCVFVQPEATGEIVPGMDLLLGFDAAASFSDRRVVLRAAGLFVRDLHFDYTGSSLKALDERLPSALRSTANPHRT